MKENKYALLIFEIVPSETRLYLLPESVFKEYEELLRLSHGNYGITEDSNDATDFVIAAVTDTGCLADHSLYRNSVGIFRDYVITPTNPIEENIFIVICTGYVEDT